MVCGDVRRIAYFYLDGTLGKEKELALLDHLQGCEDCGKRVTIHRRFRLMVRSRLAPLDAPSELRQRISTSMRSLR